MRQIHSKLQEMQMKLRGELDVAKAIMRSQMAKLLEHEEHKKIVEKAVDRYFDMGLKVASALSGAAQNIASAIV